MTFTNKLLSFMLPRETVKCRGAAGGHEPFAVINSPSTFIFCYLIQVSQKMTTELFSRCNRIQIPNSLCHPMFNPLVSFGFTIAYTTVHTWIDV